MIHRNIFVVLRTKTTGKAKKIAQLGKKSFLWSFHSLLFYLLLKIKSSLSLYHTKLKRLTYCALFVILIITYLSLMYLYETVLERKLKYVNWSMFFFQKHEWWYVFFKKAHFQVASCRARHWSARVISTDIGHEH